MNDLITEDWLREIGFKWEQGQPEKHWILWMGGAVADRNCFSSEDLGVEVASAGEGRWYCWIRADYCGRYTRFVHVRHIRERRELATLIAALTGFPFDPANAAYGSYRKPKDAARIREDYQKRLEVQMAERWGQRAMRETGQDPDGRDKVRP